MMVCVSSSHLSCRLAQWKPGMGALCLSGWPSSISLARLTQSLRGTPQLGGESMWKKPEKRFIVLALSDVCKAGFNGYFTLIELVRCGTCWVRYSGSILALDFGWFRREFPARSECYWLLWQLDSSCAGWYLTVCFASDIWVIWGLIHHCFRTVQLSTVGLNIHKHVNGYLSFL